MLFVNICCQHVSKRWVFVPSKGGGGSRKNDDQFPFFIDVELVEPPLTIISESPDILYHKDLNTNY